MNKQLEHKKVVCGDILENILLIDESSGYPTVDHFKWMYYKDAIVLIIILLNMI